VSWQRTNRNSTRQFLKSRERFVHISKAPLVIELVDPRTGVVLPMTVWPKGITYVKPKEAA
jgi:hypothetical protein